MAKTYSELTPELDAFIRAQRIFFTASAPHEGHINLSPKGMDSLRVLDPRTVAYLDVTGSGNETAAHLEQNGRLTLMFCSFDRQPLILRLYGEGEVIRPRDHHWPDLLAHFTALPGMRQIIRLRLEFAQTSCGYGVPLAPGGLEERDTLRRWAENKGEDGVREYWAAKNQTSIDGLPTYLLDD